MNTETLTCKYCGTEMPLVSDFPEFQVFECPTCGAIMEIYPPDENPYEPQMIGDQGFGDCPVCGHPLGWGSYFMRSDFMPDEIVDEMNDGIVHELSCLNCGTCVSDWQPTFRVQEQMNNKD